jgi:hypothetical protein
MVPSKLSLWRSGILPPDLNRSDGGYLVLELISSIYKDAGSSSEISKIS